LTVYTLKSFVDCFKCNRSYEMSSIYDIPVLFYFCFIFVFVFSQVFKSAHGSRILQRLRNNLKDIVEFMSLTFCLLVIPSKFGSFTFCDTCTCMDNKFWPRWYEHFHGDCCTTCI